MKNFSLKSKASYMLILLAGTVIAISCKKNITDTAETEHSTALSKDEETAIAKAGFSPSHAFKKDGGYLVEGDIFLDQKNLAIQQGLLAG